MRMVFFILLLIGLKATADDKNWWLPMQTKWVPMCFFFDASIDKTIANRKIEKLAKAYASCGIALRPFAFRLKENYPNNLEWINQAVATACPLTEALGVRGAIQIQSRYPDLAPTMCQDRFAKGCSTLCNPISISYLHPKATAAVALHESMHSNCCGPLCVDSGRGGGVSAGVGLETASHRILDTDTAFASSGVDELKISPEGCRALRAGASENKNYRFQHSPEGHEFVNDLQEEQYDLSLGQSFFDGKKVKAAKDIATSPVGSFSITGTVKRLFGNLNEEKSQ